jgi:hypothetical protein
MTFEATRGERIAATRMKIPLAEYLAHKAAGEKRCWACKQWLSLLEFGPDIFTASGWSGRCKRCAAADCARRRQGYAEKNRALLKARAEWILQHGGVSERLT